MAKNATGMGSDSKAHFPYTTKTGSLRRVLKEIPERPRPPKFDGTLLKSWGFRDSNDSTVIRVLKAVGLVNASGLPTDLYSKFMDVNGGAQVLAGEIKRVYEPLFGASHKPYAETADRLKNLFNIHSGGATVEAQMQTFKALCDSASFEGGQLAPTASDPVGGSAVVQQTGGPGSASSAGAPTVNINLHIHLPENKTRREYEDIIEDIGRYIFGRGESRKRE